jgi:putative ABC transport system permease protein
VSESRDHPPAWVGWIFRRFFPGTRGAEALEDLDREYAAMSRRTSRIVAGGWYIAQMLRPDTWVLARALRRITEANAASTRESISRGRAGISWLDVKLGIRMLVRYPGLTVLGGFAMAFAVLVGASTFEFITQVAHPELPIPDGQRAVWLRLWDKAASREETRALHDFHLWQQELESVEELGAYRTLERNLIAADGAVALVTVAEITAPAFRVAAIAPALGRVLIDDDQRAGAPPVILLGHGLWRNLFASDPAVVGSVVRLGAEPFTVVGVMPEGFGFPLAHQAWVPLEIGAFGRSAWQPRQGVAIHVFGRLAPNVSLREARTELEAVGARLTAALPETHEHIRPQIAPFARSALGRTLPGTGSFPDLLVSSLAFGANVPVLLFFVLVCGNVALLLFARAATREGEMVVRSALGASRRRIMTQLFAEALVLAVLASALGLAAAGYCIRWAFRLLETEFGSLPFWFHPSLSLPTVLYAVGLTVLGAGIAGALPGLKVTRALGTRLRQAGAGGGGFRFGSVWTTVIVCQIAVTVGFPLLTLASWAEWKDDVRLEDIVGFAADEYLSARLLLDPMLATERDPQASRVELAARFASTLRDLEDRLRADARVTAVTFTQRLPLQFHPWRQIEVAEAAPIPPDERGYRVGSTRVDIDYFDVLGAEILAGRGFHSGDLNAAPAPVIVNESFVERVLGGGNAVGKHIRYVATEEAHGRPEAPGAWLEVVGVVPDLGTTSIYGPQGVYHPALLGAVNPIHVAIHIRGNARAFSPDLRRLAVSVDPSLRVEHVLAVEDVTDALTSVYRFWTWSAAAACVLALLLSLGGIYAVTSFTVSQRTREIGVRVALGSSRRSVLTAVLRRPLVQLTSGVAAGGVLVILVGLTGGVRPTAGLMVQGVAYLVAITLVCLTACVVPVRRALSVEPSEALRVE